MVDFDALVATQVRVETALYALIMAEEKAAETGLNGLQQALLDLCDALRLLTKTLQEHVDEEAKRHYGGMY